MYFINNSVVFPHVIYIYKNKAISIERYAHDAKLLREYIINRFSLK